MLYFIHEESTLLQTYQGCRLKAVVQCERATCMFKDSDRLQTKSLENFVKPFLKKSSLYDKTLSTNLQNTFNC